MEISDVWQKRPRGPLPWLVAVAVFSTLACALAASTPTELTGVEIMDRVVHRPSWDDMTSDITLTLVSARGEQRVRKLKSYAKKYSEEESLMLMRFLEPADVRGTGFLIIEHQDADDDRYVYLPALRRVNRIAASGRGGNFMSSDFTYYDIGKPKLADWTYNRLPDEDVGGKSCYVVECIAASRQVIKETGYSKVVRWIHKENFLTVKAIYFDNRGKKWKQLEVPEIQNIGGIWFATKMVMQDLQIRHESILVFQNIVVNQHLSDAMFSQRYLARWP